MPGGEKETKNGSINKEILVFIFFLCLSSLFWYLNELGKDLETSINYPVRYINPPKDRIITGNLPERLGMVLQGPGYSILKVRISGSRAPVVVDFSLITPKKMPGKLNNYYLVSSDLKESFSRQLKADFNLVSIKPDTLFFGYDKLITKRMKVIPDIKVDVSKSYKAIVVAVPDSVTVTGPRHILDSLPGIQTKRKLFPRVSETFKSSVLLIEPKYLQLSQNRVNLEITVVRKFTDNKTDSDADFSGKSGKN